MTSTTELKPGMIGISLRRPGKFDPVAALTTFLQGDTPAKHVWMVAKDGQIWTTGGKNFAFFGKVPAAKYLKGLEYGVDFVLAEPVTPLRNYQIDMMERTNERMAGQVYGFWKFFQLEGGAVFGDGFVRQLGKGGVPAYIQHPICSQAVAAAFWNAGIPLGKQFAKKGPTAVTPEVIYLEAESGDVIRIV